MMNRDVESSLGCIDSSRDCDSLCHLRRPCLVKRTKLFRQPSGSDEGAGAITLQGSHKLLRVGSIRSSAACRGYCRGRPFLYRTCRQYPIALLQGWASEACPPALAITVL